MFLLTASVINANASSSEFCPTARQLPRNIEMSVFNKKHNGNNYVVVAKQNNINSQKLASRNEILLEAKRKIIEHIEQITVGSDEGYVAQYRMQGLQVLSTACRGIGMTLFVQNKALIEKNESNQAGGISEVLKPDPSQSAEENIMNMMRIGR